MCKSATLQWKDQPGWISIYKDLVLNIGFASTTSHNLVFGASSGKENVLSLKNETKRGTYINIIILST